MIYCDNQSCIKLTENPVFHNRSKHIEIKYHFIRDCVQRGAVKLEYVSIDEQVADILTKSLPRGKHVFFRDKMGVVKNTFLGQRVLKIMYLGQVFPRPLGLLPRECGPWGAK